MNTLKSRLKAFKLAGMQANLDERLQYAQQQQLGYTEFLELLCEDEANSRCQNRYQKGYAKAKFPAYKNIESFDFGFQPSIDQRSINDAMTCHFIQQNKNIVFIGNPGTGKTHLATALGIQALNKQYQVLFTSVAEMLQQLPMAKADNAYYQKLKTYLSPDLLILDELGFKKLPHYAADDFFEVIDKRYEQSSCIITTNKPFEQWHEVLGDHVVADAILDRVVHHAITFQIQGKSYRAKHLDKNQGSKP